MTATPSAPARGSRSDTLSGVMPPIPTRGTRISPRSFRMRPGPDQLEVGLARRREHRAHGDVVRAVGLGGARLLDAVGGDPRIMPGRQQRPRGPRPAGRPDRGCTPSAPLSARARSTRSLTMNVAPTAAQAARSFSASGRSRPDGHSFSRSWIMRLPPARASAESSTRSRPRAAARSSTT